MVPKVLKEVMKLFCTFPTIGERTATRFVLYLLSLPTKEVEKLSQAILNLKKEIKICALCFNPFTPKGKETICSVCQDRSREKTLCLVEKETNLWQIEKTKKYRGLYFILGGTLDFLKENVIGKMRVEELKKRIEGLDPQEIILALNPTKEGMLTMDFLTHLLKPYRKKITRLGKGLPLGGELEYADDETIVSSFEARR